MSATKLVKMLGHEDMSGAEGSPVLPLNMSYTYDEANNTHLILCTTNPMMFDGKTETTDVALVRKSLEASSEGATVVVASIAQL